MIRQSASARSVCVRRVAAAELGSLRDSWNLLAGGVPFRRWEWLVPWWRHYGHNRQLCTLSVWDPDGTLLGLAPWHLEQDPWKGRVIRFLGTGEVCTDYLGLLSLPGAEDEVTTALAEWLTSSAPPSSNNHADQGPLPWDLLELTGIDSQEHLVQRLVRKLASCGHVVHRRLGPSCWRIPLPATWDELLAHFSRSHRKQIRRVERRAFDTGRAVLRTVSNDDDLAHGRQILIDLHQRRRQSLGQAGCFVSAPFSSFHEEVMRHMLAAGLLRLHWLEWDHQPVAAEYHLAGPDIIYAYQAGIQPLVLEIEPGRMAAIATLQLAQQDGFRALDLLRGDEPYKAHWRALARPSVEFRVAARHGSAWWRHRMWTAASTARSWLRSQRKPVTALQGDDPE